MQRKSLQAAADAGIEVLVAEMMKHRDDSARSHREGNPVAYGEDQHRRWLLDVAIHLLKTAPARFAALAAIGRLAKKGDTK